MQRAKSNPNQLGMEHYMTIPKNNPPVKWVKKTYADLKARFPYEDETTIGLRIGDMWFEKFSKRQREAVLARYNR